MSPVQNVTYLSGRASLCLYLTNAAVVDARIRWRDASFSVHFAGDPPGEAALLRRFLDILGGYITAQPFLSVKETLACFSREFASDLDMKSMAAAAKVNGSSAIGSTST